MNVHKNEMRVDVQRMSNREIQIEITFSRMARDENPEDFYLHLGPMAVLKAELKIRSKKFC